MALPILRLPHVFPVHHVTGRPGRFTPRLLEWIRCAEEEEFRPSLWDIYIYMFFMCDIRVSHPSVIWNNEIVLYSFQNMLTHLPSGMALSQNPSESAEQAVLVWFPWASQGRLHTPYPT